jgi:condensin complex subunit 2
MPRSSRSKKAIIESPATTDVEPSREDESPKQRRPSRGKRRVSSIIPPPEAEASFASSQGGDGHERRPLVAVDINDDREEKKRRRKSAAARTFQNFGDAQENSFAGPSGSKGTSEPDPEDEASTRPKITALARANQLNAVAHAPMPAVSLDVMSSNFEEWMKMATDNVCSRCQAALERSLPNRELKFYRKSTRQTRGTSL